MKKVVIYPVEKMLYDKVISFVRQHAPKRYNYLSAFYKKEDRYNSAVAYVLLCIANNRIVEEFEIGKFGKPHFSCSDQFFSISHTKGMVSIAISDDDIAIDCETNDIIDESIIGRTFSKSEKDLVEKGFVKKNTIWTAKEAISKFYNEDWYSYPRTDITLNRGIVYDRNNRDLVLEFTTLGDVSICIVSKNDYSSEIYQVSEQTIQEVI